MATGKKNDKVKWALGGSEPDDVPAFESNDDIIKRNKGALPPKGRTRVLVKKITSKENRNGDQMLMITAEIAEKGTKKEQAYNGYTLWTNQNITEQGAPYLKAFLTAIGVTWGDFINKTVADTTVTPNVISKIGTVKIDSHPEAWVSIKHGVDQNDTERGEVGRWLPPADEADDQEDEEEPDDEDEDVDVEPEDEDEEADDEEADEDEDEDEAEDEEEDEGDEDALREELSALKPLALKKRAIRSGADEEDLPTKKADLIDLIVELELEADDDEEEEDDEAPDEDALREELEDLDLADLRNRARANGRKATALKGAKRKALIDMIVEDEIPPF